MGGGAWGDSRKGRVVVEGVIAGAHIIATYKIGDQAPG